MLQLNPPIPLETPRGKALAHFLIDYGAEHHLLWVCFQDETGECWTWPNPEVRAQANPSMGRRRVEKPPRSQDAESSWQPIETFPRDCTPVLAWDGFRLVIAAWEPASNEAGGAIMTSDGAEELTELIAWMRPVKPPSLAAPLPGHPSSSAS